jgi:glucose/arabinose dehydrogenase
MIAFGRDGYLYYGLGDGGSEGDPNLVGQRKTGYLSKILRINVSGATLKISIYAYGLRNPWRFSFDRLSGGLWIGDVGQDRYEEIDHLAYRTPAGVNFGWSYYEGDHVYKPQPIDRSRLMFPMTEYPHNPGGNCAVTGGYVYRGPDFPWLYGWYVYGDFCSGRIWKKSGPTGRPQPMAISGKVKQIASFGEGARGGLFLVSLSGSVYRFVKVG